MAKRSGKEPRWLVAARLRGTPPDGSSDWLARALGRAGVMRRAEAEAAIRAGRVSVDGRVVSEPASPVGPSSRVLVDGVEVSLAAPTRVLVLHKPEGLVTAGTDPEGTGTVFEHLYQALPPELQRYEWLAIGRLDRDTTGLLLFTNDERLVAHVARPQTHLPKTYRAKVAGAPTEAALEPLRQGVELDDGPTRPAQARCLGPDEVELILTEGRKHQVKRMLASVGLPVVTLTREAVGALRLDVPPGAWRELTAAELEEGLRWVAATSRSPASRT